MFRLRLFLAALGLFGLTYLVNAAPAMAQVGACFPTEISESNEFIGNYAGTVNCLGSIVTYSGQITSAQAINPATGQRQTIYTAFFNGAVKTGGQMTITGTYNGSTLIGSFRATFTSSQNDVLTSNFNGNTKVATITGQYLGQTLNCTVTGDANDKVTFSGACGDIVTAGFSGLASTKTGATARTQEVVLNNVIAAPAQTQQEKDAQRPNRSGAPSVRLFVADLQVESDSFNGNKSAITGITLGGTYELGNNFTFGALVPIDRMFLTGPDATRVGLVVYGQYDYEMQGDWSIKPTAFANYVHTSGSSDPAASVGTSNVYGGGAGVSITKDAGKFSPSLVSVINYDKDNSTGGGSQTLLAIGPRLAMRGGNNFVYELGAMWNSQISGTTPGADTSFYDVMGSIAYRISETFRVDATYTETLGITNFHAHRFMFGGRFVF